MYVSFGTLNLLYKEKSSKKERINGLAAGTNSGMYVFYFTDVTSGDTE